MTFVLADAAFAFACNSRGPIGVAHSPDIRFHSPVRCREELDANAVEESLDGKRGVYRVSVHAAERLVASFAGRLGRLPARGALIDSGLGARART